MGSGSVFGAPNREAYLAMGATVWVVCESVDYNMDQVAAVYSSQDLADAHVAELGGWVSECEVRDSLVSDVTDLAKKQEREAAAAEAQRQHEARQAHDKAQEIARANVKPHSRMSLCRCQTYNAPYSYVNAHGYCSFCGGFTIKAFREFSGEAALQAEIDKFNLHDRNTLRQLAASDAG